MRPQRRKPRILPGNGGRGDWVEEGDGRRQDGKREMRGGRQEGQGWERDGVRKEREGDMELSLRDSLRTGCFL